MKLLIGAAAAALMFGTVALAQTATTTSATAGAATTTAPSAPVTPSRCPAAPADPTVPDGATATSSTMESAAAAYRTWAQTMQDLMRCHHAEYDEAQAVVTVRREEHNAVADRLNAVSQSWTASSTTFCARPHMRCDNTAQTAPSH